MHNKGKLIVVSAPSGAGKTTLIRSLMKRIPELEFSVSACSRKPRGAEQDGKDYYFLNREDFEKKIQSGAFLEWEEVYPGQYYGTLKTEVERIWEKGHPVIFDVDVKGGLNIKKQFPAQTLAVFIRPPSIQTLAKRLKKRSTDSPGNIQKRIGKAREEMKYAGRFDREVVNDSLKTAKDVLYQIVNDFLNKPES